MYLSVYEFLPDSSADSRLLQVRNHAVQYFEIVFKGFSAAAGILNTDSLAAESDQGKAHGHAVVVVGFHCGGGRRPRINGNAVVIFLTADAHFPQLGDNGCDPVAFLTANVSDAPYDGGAVGEGGQSGQSDGLVRKSGQVCADAVINAVFRRQEQGAFRSGFQPAAHFFQQVQESSVSLQKIRTCMNMPDLYRNIQQGTHGVKVAGGRDIRLYPVVQNPVMLPGVDLVSVGQSAVDAAGAVMGSACSVFAGAVMGSAFTAAIVQRPGLHAELPHHFYGHLYVRPAVQAFRDHGKIFFRKAGGNEQGTHKYVSELLGKATIDMNTYGKSTGHSGNYSTNYQISGRELLTPDEVRMLDNRYALLFIRGERPVMDEKFDILKHPNVALSTDGKGKPYRHGEVTQAIANISLGDSLQGEVLEETEGGRSYELLSDEELEEIFSHS